MESISFSDIYHGRCIPVKIVLKILINFHSLFQTRGWFVCALQSNANFIHTSLNPADVRIAGVWPLDFTIKFTSWSDCETPIVGDCLRPIDFRKRSKCRCLRLGCQTWSFLWTRTVYGSECITICFPAAETGRFSHMELGGGVRATLDCFVFKFSR